VKPKFGVHAVRDCKEYLIRKHKHEVNARYDMFKQIKLVYPYDSVPYATAWVEWIFEARIYTAVKKTKFVEAK
jgi:hypothetical protein